MELPSLWTPVKIKVNDLKFLESLNNSEKMYRQKYAQKNSNLYLKTQNVNNNGIFNKYEYIKVIILDKWDKVII